jgi:F0F1-type ATP synthase gamma subunit
MSIKGLNYGTTIFFKDLDKNKIGYVLSENKIGYAVRTLSGSRMVKYEDIFEIENEEGYFEKVNEVE